jgi:tRNA-dependent cyclodipeptide synthase
MNKINLIEYPPQTGAYIVKPITRQSTGRWGDFKVARLPISVGKEYHEGEMFEATVKWCAARFDHVQVCVSDTAQRYNLAFEQGLDAETAFTKSLKAGDEWITRNKPLLDLLPSYNMTRWEEWRTRPDFATRLQQMENSYAVNTDFRDSIDTTVMDVWTRKSSALGPTPLSYRQNFLDMSHRYIMEELVVYSMRFENLSAIDVYPGTDLAVTTRFQGTPPPGVPVGISQRYLCRIKLSHNKDFANVTASLPTVQTA